MDVGQLPILTTPALISCPNPPAQETAGPRRPVTIPAWPTRILALTAGAIALVTWPAVPFSGDAASEEQAAAVGVGAELWLAPATEIPASKQTLAQAVEALSEEQADRALPVFAKATSDPCSVASRCCIWAAPSSNWIGRRMPPSTAKKLLSSSPTGHLGDAALWLAADAAELQGDWPAVVRMLQTLAANQPADPQRVQLRLGRAALKIDDQRVAAAALHRVYYEYPLTVEAAEAREELDKIDAPNPPTPPTQERVQLDLGRAERLYSAGRYTDARKAYESLRALVGGDERQMADLRLAQCDYQLKRYPAAHDALRAYVDKSRNRLQEAQFFLLNTLRQMGRKDEYLSLVRAFVDGNPGTRSPRPR